MVCVVRFISLERPKIRAFVIGYPNYHRSMKEKTIKKNILWYRNVINIFDKRDGDGEREDGGRRDGRTKRAKTSSCNSRR